MSQVKAFTVGARTFNAAQASAVKQDELLSMLTAPLMERAMAAIRVGKVIDESIVGPMLMSMPHSAKVKIAEILMGQIFVAGTAIPVTIDDFSGQMVHYNQLLAKLLIWNISDFFDWLLVVLKDAQQPQTSAEESQP